MQRMKEFIDYTYKIDNSLLERQDLLEKIFLTGLSLSRTDFESKKLYSYFRDMSYIVSKLKKKDKINSLERIVSKLKWVGGK